MELPLEILDVEIARAAAEPLADARVSRRATYLELLDRSDRDTLLAGAARRWVLALTLARVLGPDTARLALAWTASSVALVEAGKDSSMISPRDLLRALLVEVSPVRRRMLAETFARQASPVQDAATILAERRAEATRRLGPQAVTDLEEGVADAVLAAERLLAATSGLLPRGAWWDVVGESVARDASEGWPARLSVRWLFELFGTGPLTEGLRLAIGPLPMPIGATSFARALGAFGAALAEADGPSGPWCLARAPFDVRGRRRAALFASLAADPVFARKALGLGPGRARDQARVVARALLIGLRLDAARVLARDVLGAPAGERAARFEEATGAALGAPIPTSLAGVIPRLGPDDAARFAGALLAATDRRSAIERFDEDWFKSPHAARAIREEDATLPTSIAPPSAEALDRGVTEIVRTLGELT